MSLRGFEPRSTGICKHSLPKPVARSRLCYRPMNTKIPESLFKFNLPCSVFPEKPFEEIPEELLDALENSQFALVDLQFEFFVHFLSDRIIRLRLYKDYLFLTISASMMRFLSMEVILMVNPSSSRVWPSPGICPRWRKM